MNLIKVCWYLDKDKMEDLKKLADSKSLKMSSLVRIAISEYIGKETNK